MISEQLFICTNINMETINKVKIIKTNRTPAVTIKSIDSLMTTKRNCLNSWLKEKEYSTSRSLSILLIKLNTPIKQEIKMQIRMSRCTNLDSRICYLVKVIRREKFPSQDRNQMIQISSNLKFTFDTSNNRENTKLTLSICKIDRWMITNVSLPTNE